jgi:hypothetical protein
MPPSAVKITRCIHCLKLTDSPEADHVFPSSWYPDNTPPTVQRWTAPACPTCNRAFGELEKDLLLRMVLCTAPDSVATSGLATRVFKSMGLQCGQLSEHEKAVRAKQLQKIRSELIPVADAGNLKGRIAGLGPPPDEEQGPAIPIPYASLSIMAEKIARGCEFKFEKRKRYVEPPYASLTFIGESIEIPKMLSVGGNGSILDRDVKSGGALRAKMKESSGTGF